jgi:hypothetical protein
MSQRRAQLVVISSNGFSGSKPSSPIQGKLPIGLQVYSSNQGFQQRLDRLRSLRPGFVAAVERLVDDALAEFDP